MQYATLTGLVALALTGGAAATESFEITLPRTLEAGQKFQIRVQATEEQSITATGAEGDQPVDHRELIVSFDAIYEILAVDADGQPAEVAFTVDQCAAEQNGRRTEIAPSGALITAVHSSADGSRFMMNGAPLSDSDQYCLQMVAGLDHLGAAEDSVFMSSEPRQIGDSWEIDQDRAASDLERRIGQPLGTAALTGTAQLSELTDHAGGTCLVLRSRMQADGVMPSANQIPADMQVDEASVSIRSQGLMPLDASLPILNRSVRVTVNATLSQQQEAGQVAEYRFMAKQVVQRDVTPVDDGAVASVPTSD